MSSSSANSLIQIGKPATQNLIAVLDDTRRGIIAHYILVNIWNEEIRKTGWPIHFQVRNIPDNEEVTEVFISGLKLYLNNNSMLFTKKEELERNKKKWQKLIRTINNSKSTHNSPFTNPFTIDDSPFTLTTTLKAYQYKPFPLLLRPLQWIFSIYGLITFVAVLLLIFPFVIISSFFGTVKGGNMIGSLCRIWGYIWLPMVGIFHRNIYEAPIEKDKQYVFVANHISYMDIALIFQGIRTKNIRILAKAEFGKVPVFGFLYRYATVMVDRSSAESRGKSIRRLKSVIQKKVSIFIYPEGTFNETDAPLKSFYDGAFRMAIETQTPLKPVLYLDSVQRLHYKSILSLCPGKSRTVILPEIPVEGCTLADLPAIRQKTYDAMEACLIKYLAPDYQKEKQSIASSTTNT